MIQSMNEANVLSAFQSSVLRCIHEKRHFSKGALVFSTKVALLGWGLQTSLYGIQTFPISARLWGLQPQEDLIITSWLL